MHSSIITLTTDFGIEDHYVGVMKGVILSINQEAWIVDITHGVPPHDILVAGFLVRSSYSYFPPGTIHVAVVDPGVGSHRQPILVVTSKYCFVGPDNGIFSAAFEQEQEVRVFHLSEERFFLKPVSQTFHGRDIFAPVAARLSLGEAPESFGREIRDYIVLQWPQPRSLGVGRLAGHVLRADRFGNLITNVSSEELRNLGTLATGFEIQLGNHRIKKLCRSYAEAGPGEPFAIIGSSGLLEISVSQASAAELLGGQSQQEFELSVL